MRLTTFTDYSLRVLIYLAANPERRATIAEVTSAFQVSESHVAKVVHFLGASGWLENVRGRNGGMRLAVSPAEINVGEVVRLAEGSDVPAECFEAGATECRIARGCRLRGVLAQAVDAFYESLSRYTLEDLVRGSGEMRALFDWPVLRNQVIPVARRGGDGTGSAST
jgi:Rrf2 family nitric oxide-sensitive transcriptional repressor